MTDHEQVGGGKRRGGRASGFVASACVMLGILLAPLASEARVRVYRADYQGWTNCVWMDNGKAEVVIVPQVGRIMQFRLKGENGPFWEQETLSKAGVSPDPYSKEWINFGGDKPWPSPQSDWARWTPRAWPPPAGFDSMPAEVRLRGRTVEILHPVDPHYGIRARRVIQLHPRETVMQVTTQFEKVSGPGMEVGIWVITQLQHPDEVRVPQNGDSTLPGGYVLQSERVPPSLRRDSEGLVLGRDERQPYKIGADTESLIWLGGKTGLRITSRREKGGRYPDGGSSVEVYTNADPLKYVELEILGPLKRVEVGRKWGQTSKYRLFPRGGGDGLEAIKGVRD